MIELLLFVGRILFYIVFGLFCILYCLVSVLLVLGFVAHMVNEFVLGRRIRKQLRKHACPSCGENNETYPALRMMVNPFSLIAPDFKRTLTIDKYVRCRECGSVFLAVDDEHLDSDAPAFADRLRLCPVEPQKVENALRERRLLLRRYAIRLIRFIAILVTVYLGASFVGFEPIECTIVVGIILLLFARPLPRVSRRADSPIA